MSDINGNKKKQSDNDKEDDDPSIVTQSHPPSHILQDGRFIYLPPPNRFERSKFFERAIAKHGLLEADMSATAKKEVEEQKQEDGDDAQAKEDGDKTAPKVHPLAIASARLQAAGIAELNRAINLSTLVNTGEYFGLTNIVDPSLELMGAKPEGASAAPAPTPTAPAAEATATASASSTAGAAGTAGATDAAAVAPTEAASTPTAAAAAAAAAAAPNNQAQKEMQEEQRVKSAYVLKRKRAVFDKASRVLQRHQARLEAAISAQAIPDQRLRQLRPQWRLVAPEHGTRAKPHAVRPTEVIAIDVDVYDPMLGAAGGSSSMKASLVGRLASQVPRYATIELSEEFCKKEKQTKTTTAAIKKEEEKEHDESKDKEEVAEHAMDIDSEDKKPPPIKVKVEESSDSTKEEATPQEKNDDIVNDNKYSQWTIAEPFAIADPTLGKISTDFDPNKVTYLTLQFDIEKPSTGFCMSSCLEPITTTEMEKIKEEQQLPSQTDAFAEKENNEKKTTKSDLPEDDQVLVSLQHSLFCAKLFEAIRKEIMGEESSDEHSSSQPGSVAQSNHSVVWLTSESEENFLPPPSVMVQPTNSSGAALCVVHCHASEVKVQLDSEYTLRAKLVEANEIELRQEGADMMTQNNNASNNNCDSGSQTPEQLLVLCRSLLLHAQEAYHKHSLQETFEEAQKQREEEKRKLLMEGKPKGLDRIQKKDARKQPKILQNVVGLGTKMLFEQRIRKCLVRVRHWLQTFHPTSPDSLKTEWLALSLFDVHSHFCLSYGTVLTIDVTIERDEMTLISYGSTTSSMNRADGTSSGEYRKVKFHSDAELEIFLKIELRRLIRQQKQNQAADAGSAVIEMTVQ